MEAQCLPKVRWDTFDTEGSCGKKVLGARSGTHMTKDKGATSKIPTVIRTQEI